MKILIHHDTMYLIITTDEKKVEIKPQVDLYNLNGKEIIVLAEGMQKVGNEGVITVEEAKSLDSELEVVEGMQFDRGYLSQERNYRN